MTLDVSLVFFWKRSSKPTRRGGRKVMFDVITMSQAQLQLDGSTAFLLPICGRATNCFGISVQGIGKVWRSASLGIQSEWIICDRERKKRFARSDVSVVD